MPFERVRISFFVTDEFLRGFMVYTAVVLHTSICVRSVEKY